MDDKFEKLGVLIDDIDSITYGLELPMSADFHIQQLKKILPKKVQEFKDAFVEIAGENPWD